MSSEDLLRKYIRDSVISERVWTDTVASLPDYHHPEGAHEGHWGRFGPAGGRKEDHRKVFRGVVGIVAPLFIMSAKIVADLTKSASTFASHLMATVQSIFTGKPPNHARISANQKRFFKRSDAVALKYISKWGTPGGEYGTTPASNFFLREVFDTENPEAQVAQQPDTAVTDQQVSVTDQQVSNFESEFLISGVEPDLRAFISNLSAVRSATTVDDLVSKSAIALGIEGAQFSSSAIAEIENITSHDNQSAQYAILPEMKRSIFEIGKQAVRDMRTNAIDILSSNSEIYNPEFIAMVEKRYKDAEKTINSMIA